ncbi:hypothetical protein EKK58_08260 [Candidatus Dependentiae bacterium]|nr:MAG: hypothetical protein EKK58_08260 [Candidatus Dependentiae bacterium]
MSKPVSELTSEQLENKRRTAREYYHKNKDRMKDYSRKYRTENKEAIKLRNQKYVKNNYSLWCIKARAKRLGVAFDLELEDIKAPEICPILGIKLRVNIGGAPGPDSPSVDRLDPTKGYTKDNIQVISNKANTMKHNASSEELLKFAKWVNKTYMEKS